LSGGVVRQIEVLQQLLNQIAAFFEPFHRWLRALEAIQLIKRFPPLAVQPVVRGTVIGLFLIFRAGGFPGFGFLIGPGFQNTADITAENFRQVMLAVELVFVGNADPVHSVTSILIRRAGQ
jgi:hypothetical protein